MKSNKTKVSLCMNALVFAFTVFASVAMFTGFNFMGGGNALSLPGFSAFKFFTVDSNILAGVVALVLLVFQCLSLNGKIASLPKWLHLLSLAATSSVTLTMLVTVFFLVPTSAGNPLYLFANANFFMHLVTPLLCIVQFIFFECGTEIRFPETLVGIIPTALYTVYYVPNVLLHLVEGRAVPEYDWYGFFFAGVSTSWIVILIAQLLTWLFSILLWAGNRKWAKAL